MNSQQMPLLLNESKILRLVVLFKIGFLSCRLSCNWEERHGSTAFHSEEGNMKEHHYPPLLGELCGGRLWVEADEFTVL